VDAPASAAAQVAAQAAQAAVQAAQADDRAVAHLLRLQCMGRSDDAPPDT